MGKVFQCAKATAAIKIAVYSSTILHYTILYYTILHYTINTQNSDENKAFHIVHDPYRMEDNERTRTTNSTRAIGLFASEGVDITFHNTSDSSTVGVPFSLLRLLNTETFMCLLSTVVYCLVTTNNTVININNDRVRVRWCKHICAKTTQQ